MHKNYLFALAMLALHANGFSQINYLDTIWSGGVMRTFRVYAPEIYDGQVPVPLVFNFHGLGGNALNWESNTKFGGVADTANFILATPNGTINSQYGQFWNNFPFGSNVDDVLFVSNLIDTLSGQFNVDSNRVYSAGYSNGGFMGYELACKLSNRIAAIASVCGSMELDRLKSCNPSRNVPIFEMHGTTDPVVSYNGGTVFGVNYAATDSVQKFWIGHNTCGAPTILDLPNTNTADGSTIKRYTYAGCLGGVSMELYKVAGGGHTWAGLPGPNTNRDVIAELEIWDFFRKHTLHPMSSGVTFQATNPLISIAPNPFSDQLKLTVPTPFWENRTVSIFDLTGRLVAEKTWPAWAQSVDFQSAGWPDGAYLVRVGGSEPQVLRVVKI